MNSQANQIESAVSLTPRSDTRPTRLRVKKPMALTATNIHKSYQTGNVEVQVLRGADIAVMEGEFVAIVGQSGSGKSTLLHLLGTLDKPDEGEIWIGQQCVNLMKSAHRDRLRNQEIGLIFQFYHLLPELTAIENVMVPQMIAHGLFSYWKNRRSCRQRALELLERVGLGHRIHHRPSQMSGGEMQRTAIARALIAKPAILFADELTGNLDRENGEEVMKVLLEMRQEENLTIVMVTHDESIAEKADRTIHLVEGRVVA